MEKPVIAMVKRLTWKGQDFADAITDETIWNKAKKDVLKLAGSFIFSILRKDVSDPIFAKISHIGGDS